MESREKFNKASTIGTVDNPIGKPPESTPGEYSGCHNESSSLGILIIDFLILFIHNSNNSKIYKF